MFKYTHSIDQVAIAVGECPVVRIEMQILGMEMFAEGCTIARI